MDGESPPTPTVRPCDLALLAAVPVVLAAVYRLPRDTREGLVFTYTDPTILTAYTAHFVHLSPTHLVANLLAYVVIAPVCYLVAVDADRRHLFVRAFFTLIIGFPVVISLLNLAIPRNAMTFEFSAINMALTGLVPLFIVGYAERSVTPRITIAHAPPVFFVSVAGIALLSFPLSTTSLGIAGSSMLITVSYFRAFFTQQLPASLIDVVRSLLTDRLIMMAAGVYVAFLVMGFPNPVTADGGVINLYAHFTGYSLAFMVAYLAWTLGLTDTPRRTRETNTYSFRGLNGSGFPRILHPGRTIRNRASSVCLGSGSCRLSVSVPQFDTLGG